MLQSLNDLYKCIEQCLLSGCLLLVLALCIGKTMVLFVLSRNLYSAQVFEISLNSRDRVPEMKKKHPLAPIMYTPLYFQGKVCFCVWWREAERHGSFVSCASTLRVSGQLWTLVSLRSLNETFLCDSICMKGSAINLQSQLLYLCFWGANNLSK